jgi:signal transduction histidine kinase
LAHTYSSIVGIPELTPGTKLVCCGLSLMAVGVIALLLYSPPRPTTPKLQLDQFPSSSVAASAAADPKAQLLAHIGQEIKAPLHGILSLAAQVVDSLPSRLWIEKECVRRIVDSGHVMLCIMDNLLDFPAISTSQLRLQNTLFSIVDEVLLDHMLYILILIFVFFLIKIHIVHLAEDAVVYSSTRC